MKTKTISARISEQTANTMEDIKKAHGMTDSDLLRILIMFAITHRIELEDFINRAKKYCTFGGETT